MKFSAIKLIDKADLARLGEVPKWIDALLTPLNAFIEPVVSALRNRLTFDDNFQATKIETEFTSGTELKVNPQSGRLRVKGMIPVYFESKTLTGQKHILYQDGSVGITLTFSGGGSAICRIYLLLG